MQLTLISCKIRNEYSSKMKSRFFFVLFLIISPSILLLGQTREFKVKKYENGDTCFWYQLRIELCAEIELEPLQFSKHKWHFRFWSDKQVVDIWEDNVGKTHGKLTSWAKTYNSLEVAYNGKIFYDKKILTTAQIDNTISLINNSQINEIQDEDSIDEWGIGFDGITYVFETVDSTSYSFKTYWTPQAFLHLREAVVVQNFIDQVLAIVDADDHWMDFSKNVPDGCYTNDGLRIFCRPTKKEARKLRRQTRKANKY